MAGPDITRCSYDGELTVEAEWSGILSAPPTYNVTVFDGGNPLQSGPGFGSSGKVILDRPLEPDNLQYTVAAAPGQSGKAYGAALSVVAGRLTDLSATLRGEDALEVAWTLPNALVNGAHLRVEDASHNGYGGGWIQGSSGVLALSRPLDPNGSYTLYAAAGLRQSTGPEIALPLVAEALPLTAVGYDRTGRLLTLRLSVPPPGGVRPGAVLLADGAVQASYLGEPGKQEFSAQLKAPLDPAVHYTVRPFLRTGAADGPFGPAVTVLVSAPAVTRVGWSGANLDVAWLPLAAPPAPTGGMLTFAGPGSHPGPTQAVEATSWSGVPDPPFAPGQSEAYTVIAANTRGVATGPAGDGLAVIVDSDALLGAGYDGTVLRASWPTTPRPGATGARLLVLDGDSVVATVDAGATAGGAAVAVALDAGQSYTAALQWIGDRSTGPIGPRTALIATAPMITRSIAGDAAVTLDWDPPAGAGPAVTGYQAILSAPGLASIVQAASSGIAFAAPVVSAPPLGLVARVVALAAGGVSGPPSAPLRVVGGLTQLRAARVEQDGLQLSWPALPGTEDYTLLIGLDGTMLRQEVSGTSATLDLGPLRGHRLDVSVAPGSGVALGRAGTPVPVPLLGPTLGAPTVNGTVLTVAVSGPAQHDTGATVDRYEVVLLRNGQPASDRLVMPGNSGTLTVPVDPSFDPSASWTLAVRAGAGVALSPATTVAVLLGTPVVESVLAEARQHGTDLEIVVGRGSLPASGGTLTAAVLHGDDPPLTKPVSAGGSCTISVPDGTGVYTVVARGEVGGATGPWSAPVAALMTAPAITAARCDGDRLSAFWNDSSMAEFYDVGLIGGDGTALAEHTPGQGITLPLESSDGATLTVRGALGAAYGPIASLPLLTAPIQLTSVVTDPATGLPTVSWPALTSPAGVRYQVQLLRDGRPDGAPVAAASASLTLAAPLVPGARQAVCVRALATVAGTALTGPFGPPLALPVGLPAIVAVDYDGTSALVRWRGVEGATGYAVDVVVDATSERAGSAEAGAAAREVRLAVTPRPDPGKTWTVVVRALAGTSSGPRATAPLVTPGLLPALDAIEDRPLPRLFRSSRLAATPQPVTAYLPQLGLTAASVPADPPAGAPFVLARNPSSEAFPYTLTIGGAALSFAAADRASVRSRYDALLKEAEALTPPITPRGVAILRDVIARLLPQTFAETLYYAYGLGNPGSAVDLRPGTILRVGSPPFQAIPGTKPPTYAQGYALGATTDFEIDDYGTGTSWLTGFDAFLSWLVANENLIVRDPAHSPDWSVVSGAADPADLYYPGLRRPFYRLFFPQYLQGLTEPAVSSLAQQFTLLGADTYTAISGATPGALPATVRGAAFRGRSVLRVCIRVRVDDTDQVVPVGTTAGNVLDRLARRAPGTPPALRGVTLERALGAAVLDPAEYDAGANQPVRLGWRGTGFAPDGDVLSLPLLPGDRLRTGEPW